MFCWGYEKEGSSFTVSEPLDLEELRLLLKGYYRSPRQAWFLCFPTFTQIQQIIFCLKRCLNVLNRSFIYSVCIEHLPCIMHCDGSWGISGDMGCALKRLTWVIEADKETCHWRISTQQGNKWQSRCGGSFIYCLCASNSGSLSSRPSSAIYCCVIWSKLLHLAVS